MLSRDDLFLATVRRALAAEEDAARERSRADAEAFRAGQLEIELRTLRDLNDERRRERL